MSELLTAAQMRAIEEAAIASGEVTGLELMERAGRGVVEAIFEEWPELAKAPFKAVVLCGPGNNGGDGFVVARLLKEWGCEVEVFLYGDPEKLPPDAKVNYERWCALGGVSELTERAFRTSRSNSTGTLVVDALFGTGLSRALEGEALKLIRHLSGVNGDHYRDYFVSIDVPSGLCADSGTLLVRELPAVFQGFFRRQGRDGREPRGFIESLARITVTFDAPKAGHFLEQGPRLCGKVVTKPIGLEDHRIFEFGEIGAPARSFRPPLLRLISPSPLVSDPRPFVDSIGFKALQKYVSSSHKYTHGHALILTGPHGTTGAARLAARGALRIGAGLVTLGVPEDACHEVAAQITAIMQTRIEDSFDLDTALRDPRVNALCLGPGLGHVRAQDLVPTALQDPARKVVLDADALSAFSEAPEMLFEQLHLNCVLTPHEGEFKRLFPDLHAKLTATPSKGPAYSKVDATREAAARAGCTVLFKGPDTVIADQTGRAVINSAHYDRAAPWLATAGSGDVLAGFITGLLARGFWPIQAAETAAWLHVECARTFGPGLIAEDIPETLPGVLRKLAETN